MADHPGNIPAAPPVETSAGARLVAAAENGNEAHCLTLLDEGADVNHADAGGMTALHYAARKGLANLCLELVERGVLVDKVDSVAGQMALHYAAAFGGPSICRLLVQAGAKFLSATVEMETADGSSKIMTGFTPLWAAMMNMAAQMSKTSGFLANSSQWGAYEETCQLLLELGAKLGLNTWTSLQICCSDGKVATTSPLHFAAGQMMLMAAGPTGDGKEGDEASAKLCRILLCDEKAQVDGLDHLSCTPLYYAATCGNVKTCRLLLESGSNVDHQGFRRTTPLSMAAACGHTDLCKLLLEHGAEIESTDDAGCTPLVYAAKGGHAETCQFLLLRNANVKSATGQLEGSPLPMALAGMANIESKVKVIEILMDNGADCKMGLTWATHNDVEKDLIKAIVLHKNYDPTILPYGAFLKSTMLELSEWRSMPCNLKEAIGDFARDMRDREPQAREEDGPSGKKRKI